MTVLQLSENREATDATGCRITAQARWEDQETGACNNFNCWDPPSLEEGLPKQEGK
ncbi:hypothetical protein IFM89_027140, partial [Coptis chinensis]